MSLWRGEVTLEQIRHVQRIGMAAQLGMQFTELGPDFLRGTMPVESKTMQPFGVLHGGASVAFAETLASTASWLCVDRERYQCFGQEINANHLKAVKSGLVTGTTRPFHIGARSQVWGIEIVDDLGRLACVSRITMAIVEVVKK